MTDATLALAAGCVLQIAEGRFDAIDAGADVVDAGFVEHTHLELVASPSCRWLEIALPPGSTLGEHRAKQKLGDGTGVRLGEERWEAEPRSADGSGRVKLHTPELLQGDRVFVDFDRTFTGPVTWRPGPARYASAEVSGGALRVGTEVAPRIWKADVDDTWAAEVGGVPEPPPDPVYAAVLPAGDVRIERTLTLTVPPGDPLMELYPGGGSSVTVEDHLTFPPERTARAQAVDAPPDATFRCEPEGSARLEAGRVVVQASEGPTRVVLRWERPDAPTEGRKGDLDALQVVVPDGEVRWEGDAWYLARVRDRTILPGRDALVKALDYRFRTMSLPEPSAPMELRHSGVSWDTAAALRPALFDRVVVGDWPADPLFPRKLVKARKSGAVTPGEAGLILWLYANQLHLPADWALVRPASAGPAPETAPVGYETVLLRIGDGDGARWIAPTCRVCAPFELPPDLEGAGALGPHGIRETPPPTPGRHELTVGADGAVQWRLEGPPALLLRLRLSELAPEARSAELARLIGGPGGSVTWTEGLDQAGDPVLVQGTHGDGLYTDPLRLPPADASGTVWVDWVGERVARWPDHEVPPAELDEGPLHYRRVREGGALVESLTLDARAIDAATVAKLDDLRRGISP